MVPVTTNQKYIMDQPSINNQPSFIGGEPGQDGYVLYLSVPFLSFRLV